MKMIDDLTQMDYPQYNSYKDSGVDWLGEIPEEWHTEKGKWLFNKMDRPIREDDGIVTCFRDGEVTLRSNRRTDGFTNALKEHGYQGIRKGDLVIHQMDAFAGAIGVSDSEGKSTPVYSVCVPKKPDQISPHYYMYFMRSMALRGFILSLAKGIRERSTDFRYNDFAKLDLPLPPYNVQIKISKFIESRTTQIDQAITLKQQQIAKLEEYKQIVIQNAVTKGLNPDAPMKDSDVDWIGDIPEHWEVKRLMFVTENFNKKVLGSESKLPYLGMESIESKTGQLSNETSEAEGLASYFKEDQILFGKLRPYLAKVYLTTFEGLCSTEFMVMSVRSEISNTFLKYQLLSNRFIAQINSSTYGSKMPRASAEYIKRQSITLPPTEEQKLIVDYIDSITNKVNKTLSSYNSQIDRLKEYKTILINQAVTGKLKVS
ncbi:restriction endonuclease subunit S [Psychrobacter sp. JCM 18900]|uniref:restriction endonuclease subunit S n=1 Tax=Psychrobacter sp. JCM 18900 TaxID=1298608 RepID=UPI001918F9E2|nr:restriction endonuclease subunit S [Psychrobacter sp. JCM 18900]